MQINLERDVLPHLPDKRWVEKLKQYQSPVVGEGGMYRYFSPTGAAHGITRFLPGITTLITDLLIVKLPKEVVAMRKASAKHRIETAQQRAERVVHAAYVRSIPLPLRQSPQMKLTGFMRGSLIHRQIEDAVLLDKANFLIKHKEKMHPWAARLLEAIFARNWCPIASEFVVYDLELDAATRIDLVCVDRVTGRLEFIEDKTGDGGGRFTAPSLKLEWIKDAPPDQWHQQGLAAGAAGFDMSPANRAKIQQTLGVIMAVRDLGLYEPCQRCPAGKNTPASKRCKACHRNLCDTCLRADVINHRSEWTPVKDPFGAHVAHVCETGVDIVPVLPQFLAREGIELYDYMSDPARRAELKSKKKRKFKNK